MSPRLLCRLAVMALMAAAATAIAQEEPEVELRPRNLRVRENPLPEARRDVALGTVTLATGTKIPLVLRQAISTRNARVGDPVYAQTNFPVAQDDRMIIPSGTYVQGTISHIKKAGRIKGRAEVLFHFTTLIFPNGYTVSMPGSVDNVPGAERSRVKGSEGTVQQDGEKGKDIGTIASTAATGATIGGLATQSGKGAGIGAGVGGATGLALALLTRGTDVHLENGTSIEMVLARPLTLEEAKIRRR